MAPPNNISPREAPYTRAIMKLRSDGRILMDDWEKYDELAKRQIIRKSKPCWVNMDEYYCLCGQCSVPRAYARDNTCGGGKACC